MKMKKLRFDNNLLDMKRGHAVEENFGAIWINVVIHKS